jgi:antitoxin CcdA
VREPWVEARDLATLGMNLSRALEEKVADEVRQALVRQWLEENQEAIASYNQRIEQKGAFSDGLRSF